MAGLRERARALKSRRYGRAILHQPGAVSPAVEGSGRACGSHDSGTGRPRRLSRGARWSSRRRPFRRRRRRSGRGGPGRARGRSGSVATGARSTRSSRGSQQVDVEPVLVGAVLVRRPAVSEADVADDHARRVRVGGAIRGEHRDDGANRVLVAVQPARLVRDAVLHRVPGHPVRPFDRKLGAGREEAGVGETVRRCPVPVDLRDGGFRRGALEAVRVGRGLARRALGGTSREPRRRRLRHLGTCVPPAKGQRAGLPRARRRRPARRRRVAARPA